MAGAFDCVPEGTIVPGVPGRHIVTPDRSEVVTPQGEASMVTFTTCHPQWANTHRLIVHGAGGRRSEGDGVDVRTPVGRSARPRVA
nr:sortase [Corynebacterium xerosis]